MTFHVERWPIIMMPLVLAITLPRLASAGEECRTIEGWRPALEVGSGLARWCHKERLRLDLGLNLGLRGVAFGMTEIALARGFSEGNVLMRSRGLRIAGTAAAAGAAFWVRDLERKGHRGWASALRWFFRALLFMDAAWDTWAVATWGKHERR